MRRIHSSVPAAVLAAGVWAGAQASQLVVNPYFTEWASAKPVGWHVLGDPAVWWTDSRPGAARTVNMTVRSAGDGLMQRLAVEPGRRHFVQAWTGVAPSSPGEIIVRDVVSGDVLFQRQADRPWRQEHVGFFTPGNDAVDIVLRAAKGGGHLAIDNVTLAAVEVDPTPSRVGRQVYCSTRFVSSRELRVLVPELTAPGTYDITVRHDDWLGEAQAVTVKDGLKITE